MNKDKKVLDTILTNLPISYKFETCTEDCEASAIIKDDNGNEYRIIVRKETIE